jgi:hypothetical protein
MPFCIQRSNKSKRAGIFTKLHYIVDNLHIKGHIGKNCHPANYPNSKSINTVVCEQKNFWLGKYKNVMKHMGQYRFHFFLFILYNSFNQLCIDNKLKYLESHSIKEKYFLYKRKFDQLTDSDNQLELSHNEYTDSIKPKVKRSRN